jgi:hypothetical protein
MPVVGSLIIAVAAAGSTGCVGSTAGRQGIEAPDTAARILPWEWWRDLATIASVSPGDRVVMRSSHCPSGCEFDRHAPGDHRFLRTMDNGEGVIFSADGAGAVTRIWMVMGDGISEPLNPSIRLRIRIDGRPSAVVDVPLPELFDGSTAPFLPPLVADLRTSGGGNVSYVPVAFRNGCEISLVGAENAKIWFQVSARLSDDATGVRSFTGDEDFGELSSILARAGGDPWPDPSMPVADGVVVLPPGGAKVIAELAGPDLINGIVIRAPRKHWGRLGLRLTFDDRPPQLVPLLDLTGVMTSDSGPSGSLMMGADEDGDLYCYAPMPFFEKAIVELMRRPVEGPDRARVEFALRTAGTPPPDDAGYFGMQARRLGSADSEGEIDLVDLDGPGKLIGLVTDLRPANGRKWTFLEADERIRVNGEPNPSWHGTGVEDLFNGGFYFRGSTGEPAPFLAPFAGATLLRSGYPRAVMYRLLLQDAIPFSAGVHATLEEPAKGGEGVRGRSVAFVYTARGVLRE